MQQPKSEFKDLKCTSGMFMAMFAHVAFLRRRVRSGSMDWDVCVCVSIFVFVPHQTFLRITTGSEFRNHSDRLIWDTRSAACKAKVLSTVLSLWR